MQNPRSAQDQIAVGREHCARHRWVCEEVATDEARTGRTTAKRSGYFSLMAAVEARRVDVVVVEDITRLGRDAADLMMMARTFNEAGAVIYTFAGGIVSGIELAMRAQMAQENSEETARRVKRGHRSAALRGRVIGGVAYGYELLETPDEDGDLRGLHDGEKKIVFRIYQDLAAGVSPHAICAALNVEGERPPGGGKLWRPKAITGDKRLMTGIGRNPLYAGKLIFGKSNSTFVSSTGQVKVTPGASSEYVLRDMPKLRIVPDDLWQAVQDILDERSTTVPNNSRNPSYLLSKLVKCGSCGQPFSMIGSGMGCTGRRYGNRCSNRRRVPREDLERSVVEGIADQILQPHILDLYLVEYRRESTAARGEYEDRASSMRARLQALEGEITRVMSQVRAGDTDFAAEILRDELNRLGAERGRLEREARQPAPPGPLTMDTEAVLDRLRTLLADLSAALNGPERDATRARDILRSIITEVRVTPIESDGKQDGRGVGPVRVTVVGSLTELLGHASPDRVIQRRGTTVATLDLPTVAFEFWVDLTKDNSCVEGAYADIILFSRMLDDAYAPVSTSSLTAALDVRRDRPSTVKELQGLENRARRAIYRLKEAGQIRAVRLSWGEAGWVWDERAISDAEWQERAKQPDPPKVEPIVRMFAPQAAVVVVTPSRTEK